jgi:NDP-sugar pyrophosphorylase family protein
MNIIITMAGAGRRFRDAGYDLPKYRIEAHGKTLFEWSLASLRDYLPHAKRVVFLVRAEDGSAAFIAEQAAKLGIERADVTELDYLTDGQATTALIGMRRLGANEPVMIYNIDTYIEPGELRFDQIRGAGYVPCFHGKGDHWSFVRLGESGRAVEVSEKRRISDNCSLGAYYFSSAALYRDAYERLYGAHWDGVREKYIAPMYNLLIADQGEVRISLVDPRRVHVLGTPEELDAFLALPRGRVLGEQP